MHLGIGVVAVDSIPVRFGDVSELLEPGRRSKILAYESEKLAFEAEQQKDNDSGDSATPQVPPTSRGAQGATGASPQFIDESFLPQREQLSVEEFNRLNQPRRRKGDSQ